MSDQAFIAETIRKVLEQAELAHKDAIIYGEGFIKVAADGKIQYVPYKQVKHLDD